MSFSVLIVDDSAITRTVIKRTLSMCGLEFHSIAEAGNGLEALDVLEREWVDLVLCDINMPEMNGVELVERMAQDELMSRVPVVIVSSARNKPQIDALVERGVRGHVKKPFKPETIRDVLQGVLGVH